LTIIFKTDSEKNVDKLLWKKIQNYIVNDSKENEVKIMKAEDVEINAKVISEIINEIEEKQKLGYVISSSADSVALSYLRKKPADKMTYRQKISAERIRDNMRKRKNKGGGGKKFAPAITLGNAIQNSAKISEHRESEPKLIEKKDQITELKARPIQEKKIFKPKILPKIKTVKITKRQLMLAMKPKFDQELFDAWWAELTKNAN